MCAEFSHRPFLHLLRWSYNINRWRDILCFRVRRINTVKMTTLPSAIYRFNAIPIKLPMVFFREPEQKYFTIYMETQKTLNSQTNLEKEEWSWRNQPSWLQIILQSYNHQDSTVLTQNRNTDQCNKMESPEMSPRTYGYLIFDKGGKNRRNTRGKDSLFNKWWWESWTDTCRRMKREHFLTQYTKINSKWIKDEM